MSHDDQLRELNAQILDIFPVQVDGLPRRESQYLVHYITLLNGLHAIEGAETIHRPLDVSIGDTIAWFKVQRAKGDDLLVWRVKPSIETHDDETPYPVLRLRCHTMKSADAAKARQSCCVVDRMSNGDDFEIGDRPLPAFVPSHGLTQEQITATLARLNAKILSIFPVSLDGFPSARSQYGIDYLSIANGVVKREGEPVIEKELPNAIADCVTWFKNQRAKGHDLLVWRKRPEIEQDRHGHPRLFMRCHTMDAKEATTRLAAAIAVGIRTSEKPDPTPPRDHHPTDGMHASRMGSGS